MEDDQICEITSDCDCIPKDQWLISIEKYVDQTTKKPQMERVPSLLRQNKSYTNCYDPLIVSIGPYHHGNQKCEEFEKLKIPISHKFWYACIDNHVSIEQLYEEVVKVGKSARECYNKGWTDGYDDELFNRMMFLDACFVLHIMFIVRIENAHNWTDENLKEVYDRLDKSFYHVLRDLFLLENQIPLLTNSFSNAVKKFLKKMTGRSSESGPEEEIQNWDESPHLLHLVRQKLIWPFKHEKKNLMAYIREPNARESYLSVTELQSAGIYFKPSKTRNLIDVEFKSRLVFGTLTLPSIRVDHLTKTLLLNLVAYEMCPHGPSDLRVTSYICLMDSLIDNADDVKELKKRRILINKLGSDEKLAQFFNEISTDLVPPFLAYLDAKLKIDNHCKHKGHIWMAEWVHKYFSSPWALMAFLGAILALALTMAQTYFAAYQR
ncbi:Hypothetical predicted protein [Olea europaea subsp. europaea]|uniref:Uncharacterized protein n=1 Tax=Olea europaea subsp. europaea TaxID=158383 RepID=A0A8S0TQP7_OLEEU|nr:Hypothetical predicted protein [Olea europaea subsp. europaea]